MVKQGLVETILEEGVSSLRDWRFFYELEGGPKVRNAKKNENPWRPWAEAMLKWSCTPPFKEYCGSFLMRDYCRVPLVETLRELNNKDYRRSWEKFSQEIPEFLMSEAFIIECANLIKPHQLPAAFHSAEMVNKLAVINKAYAEAFPNMLEESSALAICARDGDFFEKLPHWLKTAEVLDKAMERCSWAFSRAQDSLKTPERCLKQVSLYKSLYSIPEGFITPQMCDIAISYSLPEIQYAPSSMVSTESIFAGASRDPSKVRAHVPAEMQTAEFIERVIESNGKALYELSDSAVSDDMIRRAIERNVLNYRQIRRHRQTDEMADLLISLRADAFPMLDSKHQTLERALKAVKKGFPYALSFMKMDELSDEELLEAVKQDYKMMAMLPANRITYEMNVEALRQNGDLLRMVNENARTPDVCLEALSGSDLALRHVPDSLKRNSRFVAQALRRNPGLEGKFGSTAILEL